MDAIRSVKSIKTIFLILQGICASTAFAAGFQINELSASMLGNANAGAAAEGNDVSTMFFNPATLGSLKTNQVYVSGMEILPHIKVYDASAIHTVFIPGIPPTEITAPVLGESSQSNVGQSAFVPSTYVGYRINDHIVAGLAIVAPFGLATNYKRNSVLRFAADYSFVKTIDIVPSLAYSLSDQLSLGVGVQIQYAQAIFSNFDGPYLGIPATDAFIAMTQPTRLKAHGWGTGYTVGLLYAYDACTRLGISYRSSVFEHIKDHGKQYIQPGPTVPPPSQEVPFNAYTRVSGNVRTPAVLTLSAQRDMDQFTIKATAGINYWNTFKRLAVNMPDAFITNLTIPTKWRNSWFFALGADYGWNDQWTVRAGVAFDETPTRNQYRDPRIPDTDRWWGSVGATYAMNKCIEIDAAWTHLFMRKQHVSVTQSYGSNPLLVGPLESNTVSARYKGYADIIGVALRYNF